MKGPGKGGWRTPEGPTPGPRASTMRPLDRAPRSTSAARLPSPGLTGPHDPPNGPPPGDRGAARARVLILQRLGPGRPPRLAELARSRSERDLYRGRPARRARSGGEPRLDLRDGGARHAGHRRRQALRHGVRRQGGDPPGGPVLPGRRQRQGALDPPLPGLHQRRHLYALRHREPDRGPGDGKRLRAHRTGAHPWLHPRRRAALAAVHDGGPRPADVPQRPRGGAADRGRPRHRPLHLRGMGAGLWTCAGSLLRLRQAHR